MPGSIAEGEDDVPDSRVPEPLLSVVVITHNERDRIAACLDSVFEACAPLDRFEVVLVDSRSTDGTVDVASAYPITVLQLPTDPGPTPSAGRYVGTVATRGDLVLFVDGDMVLETDWLADACERVRDDGALGGIDGYLNRSSAEEPHPIDVLRGVVLYERAPLEAAGGFDPYLQSMEDIDVSYRLAAAGYDLLRLPGVVATHPVRPGIDECARRWANGYYHGRGELLRKYGSRPPVLARLLYRTRLYLAIFVWLGLGAVGWLVAGTSGLLAWAATTAVGLAGTSLVKGTDWTADKVFNCWPVYAGMALGFPGRQPRPSEYPLEDVETLQSAPPQTGTVGVATT